MSTTEKLRLLAFKKKKKKKKKPFSGRGKFCSAATWYIYLAASEVSHATRIILRRSRCQTKQTELSFLIRHAGAHLACNSDGSLGQKHKCQTTTADQT